MIEKKPSWELTKVTTSDDETDIRHRREWMESLSHNESKASLIKSALDQYKVMITRTRPGSSEWMERRKRVDYRRAISDPPNIWDEMFSCDGEGNGLGITRWVFMNTDHFLVSEKRENGNEIGRVSRECLQCVKRVKERDKMSIPLSLSFLWGFESLVILCE